MQNIELSSGPVYYRHSGQGLPLLLLHGWGGSSRYWDETLTQLATIRCGYAPDLPGYGQSPPLHEPASNERLAALVIEFADALGLRRFDLNGHSFAASIAVYVAAHWPERVNRLVLTCASTYRNTYERHVVQQVHRVMALWLRLRRPWMAQTPLIYRGVARRFFHQVPPDDALLQANFADFLAMDHATAIAGASSAGGADYNVILQQVAAPTLLIGARQDAIMPTVGTPVIARLIPNCQLVWLEECGHLPMIERPEEYNRVVCAFLNGTQDRNWTRIHADGR